MGYLWVANNSLLAYGTIHRAAYAVPAALEQKIPEAGTLARGVQNRANRTTPRTRQEVPDAPIALPAPRRTKTPKVALTTRSRGRGGAPTPHPTPTPYHPTPTYAPSASCADDATWSYGTKASNTCAYVARKLKRCKAKNTDGFRNALEACPKTCGTC